MSTLKIALQDASHAIVKAVEKERVRDALHTGTPTLPVLPHHVVDSESNSREELQLPSLQQQQLQQQQQQQQRCNSSSCSYSGKDSEEEEDPIMAAFLEAQDRSSVLNFDDWARLIVLLSNRTVSNDGNVSNVQ